MIDGAHSFIDGALHLKNCGAQKIILIATHGILSGDSVELIQACDAVDEVFIGCLFIFSL